MMPPSRSPASIRERTIMPKFVIERTVPGAAKLTDAEIREASLRSLEALRTLGPEIQWIHSFICDDKIYCIYFSPDERLIVEHGRLLGLPVDRVEAVRRMVDPANYELPPGGNAPGVSA
jgi:Protein of unknown function (DUF4242)